MLDDVVAMVEIKQGKKIQCLVYRVEEVQFHIGTRDGLTKRVNLSKDLKKSEKVGLENL